MTWHFGKITLTAMWREGSGTGGEAGRSVKRLFQCM